MRRTKHRLRNGYTSGLSSAAPILRQFSRTLRTFAIRRTPWCQRAMRLPQRQSALLYRAEFTNFVPRRRGDVRRPCIARTLARIGSVRPVRFWVSEGFYHHSIGVSLNERTRVALYYGDDGVLEAHASISRDN